MSHVHTSEAHAEVLDALIELTKASGASSGAGERIRVDRASRLQHLGLRTPNRRRRVAAGFSFADRADSEVLQIWDGIWQTATVADVMFAALDHYRPLVAAHVDASFWTTTVRWIDRIENWAHADDLARLYSWRLAAEPDTVLPTLQSWSRDDDQWLRRVAVVSLVHYSGKNAVFLPIDSALELIGNCVDDQRETVHKAVGWVLRENMRAYPNEVIDLLHAHRTTMPAAAIRRATEKMPRDERDELRAALR